MQQSIVLSLGAATAILIAILSLLRGDAKIFAYLPVWLAPMGHFTLYAVLAFLLTRIHLFAASAAPFHALGAFLLATGFGAALEYTQRFRPGRFARVSDVFIDAAGAAIGVLLALPST